MSEADPILLTAILFPLKIFRFRNILPRNNDMLEAIDGTATSLTSVTPEIERFNIAGTSERKTNDISAGHRLRQDAAAVEIHGLYVESALLPTIRPAQ